MGVDERGRQQISVGVQNLRRGGGNSRCDVDDTTLGDEHVASGAAIGQRRVTNEKIGHRR